MIDLKQPNLLVAFSYEYALLDNMKDIYLLQLASSLSDDLTGWRKKSPNASDEMICMHISGHVRPCPYRGPVPVFQIFTVLQA